jgi:hypothetical protein
MQTPILPKHRSFRFSLRTLLVAITLSGLWLGYYVNWIHERHKPRAVLVGQGTVCIEQTIRVPNAPPGCPPPNPFSWTLAMLGEQPVNCITLSGSERDTAKHTLAESYRKIFPESEVVCLEDVPPHPRDESGPSVVTLEQLREYRAALLRGSQSP